MREFNINILFFFFNGKYRVDFFRIIFSSTEVQWRIQYYTKGLKKFGYREFRKK